MRVSKQFNAVRFRIVPAARFGCCSENNASEVLDELS